jgi:PAS domain S-box-containing protein
MEQSREQPDNRDEAMRARLRRLAAIVESSEDAIIGKDLNGIITDWNNGAQRLYGYSADEVIGKPISILVPSDRVDDFIEIMRKIRAGESVKHFETVRRKKNGTCVQVSLTVSPVVDTDGRIIGASAIARDVSERQRQEAAVRESEERFSLIANATPVMIWMSGVDKLCNYFNHGWLEFTGRSLKEELGNGRSEGVHPEDLAQCSETYTQSFDRRESFAMEYRLRRHDGQYRWVFDRGVPRFEMDGAFAGYVGSCVDVTERKLVEQIRADVSRTLLEAQEQERTRIARELHDDIGQKLALLSVEISQMKETLPHGELRSQMDALEKQAVEISADTQSLSHELHSSKLEYLGLVLAMKNFSKEFEDKHNVEIEFDGGDVPSVVPQNIALCLFRVMQEGLRNSLKHSGVRFFKVNVQGSPTEIRLSVRDSGVGFEPELAKGTQGLGLISMRERVRLVNGTISITSSPQSGAEIRVFVPLLAGKPMEKTELAGA